MTTSNDTTILILLTQGYFTVIDPIDSDLAKVKWSTLPSENTCYAKRHTKRVAGKRKTIQMHQVILSRILGRELLPGEKVDHEDGDGLNNRRENLRLATTAQNGQNRNKTKKNTTGFKGVRKKGKSFQAAIQVNSKWIYLGTHATPELAAAAYDQAAIKHHGEFAQTNLGRNR